MNESYQGLLGLDRLPKESKTLNVAICFIITTGAAVWNYYQTIAWTMVQTPLHWVIWMGPTCIAVAWLRLTGIKWRHALLLFIFVPIATFAIIAAFGWLVTLFYDIFLAN